MLDLQPSADQMASVVAGISDDQLDGSTPCDEMPVRQLIAHVIGLSIAFRDAARKVDGPTTSTPPGSAAAVLPNDWREQVPARLGELVSAWREPDAWQGDTQAGGVALPGAVAGQVANNELLCTVGIWPDRPGNLSRPAKPTFARRGTWCPTPPTTRTPGRACLVPWCRCPTTRRCSTVRLVTLAAIRTGRPDRSLT